MAGLFTDKFFELLPLLVSDTLRKGLEGDAAFVDPMLQFVGGVRPINLAVSSDDLENGGGIEAPTGVITLPRGHHRSRRFRFRFR